MGEPTKLKVGSELAVWTCVGCDGVALTLWDEDAEYGQDMPAGWLQQFEYYPQNGKEEPTGSYLCGSCKIKED